MPKIRLEKPALPMPYVIPIMICPKEEEERRKEAYEKSKEKKKSNK